MTQYKKPPRDEKPSELRTVWGVRGDDVSKHFPLICLITCFTLIINLVLNII